MPAGFPAPFPPKGEEVFSSPFLPESIRAVFFDAVGTLIHPEPPAPAVYAAVGQRFGSQRTPADVAGRFRRAFRRQEELDYAAGLRTGEEREVARWRSIVAEVLDDVSNLEACFEELFAHFARPEAWRCAEDAAPVLAWLETSGRMLGLASNFDGRLRGVVAGLPALRPLRQLVISSEVGWRKPAPSFFEAVCQHAGLKSSQILLVGDDWVNDYQGARALGMPTVLLDRENRHEVPAGERLARLTDLLAQDS
jgi:putative hydrolase of the HAD superfamily